jgi:hypothetical protein
LFWFERQQLGSKVWRIINLPYQAVVKFVSTAAHLGTSDNIKLPNSVLQNIHQPQSNKCKGISKNLCIYTAVLGLHHSNLTLSFAILAADIAQRNGRTVPFTRFLQPVPVSMAVQLRAIRVAQ